MSEYFMWVNPSKREYINSSNFKWNDKFPCHHWVGSGLTNAALTLMADRWRGDLVALVGDETGVGFYESDCCAPRMRRVLEATEGYDPYEYADDYFLDVSTCFSCTRGEVSYQRIGIGPNADWVRLSLSGPFDREIVTYPYVVNEKDRGVLQARQERRRLRSLQRLHDGREY